MSVRRLPYTKPLPPQSKIVTVKGKKVVRWTDGRGKRRKGELTEDGRLRLWSKDYYGELRKADDTVELVRLCSDKAAAELLLAQMQRKESLASAGVRDPYEQHRKRPLTEHLDDWERSLQAEEVTAKHARQTAACARRVIAGCGFHLLDDLSASKVKDYLATLRKKRLALVELDPTKEEYTRKELCELLQIKPAALSALLARHRLAGTGNGKKRRYPPATAEALLAMRSRGRASRPSTCTWMPSRRSAPGWAGMTASRAVPLSTCPEATSSSTGAMIAASCPRRSCGACWLSQREAARSSEG